jgi:ADP-ribosylglycohydrolase
MIGAIIGDIIGSPYEFNNIKTTDFPLFGLKSRFTDDTVLTMATAVAIMKNKDYGQMYKKFGRKYFAKGYGSMFKKWLLSDSFEPYDSWGNGSAMRVSPIGYAFNTEKEVLEEAEKSAIVTHNHPEAVKGAQAIALAILYARQSFSKDKIALIIKEKFDYDFSKSIEELRENSKFDVSCKGTVISSFSAFLASMNFEDAIRLAISLGGDSDTIACITGSMAEAYYKKIPKEIKKQACKRLPFSFRFSIYKFYSKVK